MPRSASEAFLYRRLETLPETAGRFRLTWSCQSPSIPWGRMAVDFFCADSRLVLELDGAQHLADAEAYRRDQRKDAMLQKNGYFVLRFLLSSSDLPQVRSLSYSATPELLQLLNS